MGQVHYSGCPQWSRGRHQLLSITCDTGVDPGTYLIKTGASATAGHSNCLVATKFNFEVGVSMTEEACFDSAPQAFDLSTNIINQSTWLVITSLYFWSSSEPPSSLYHQARYYARIVVKSELWFKVWDSVHTHTRKHTVMKCEGLWGKIYIFLQILQDS